MQRPEEQPEQPEQPDRPETDLSGVAEETPEESVEAERQLIGDQPDAGDVVPPDQSQSEHDDTSRGGGDTGEGAEPNPFAPRVPDPGLS